MNTKRFVLCVAGACLSMSAAVLALTPLNLVTGDGGRSSVQADLGRLNWLRVVYGSEGGPGEAFYGYDGRLWARWETDFPQGDDNLMRRLGELTRIKTNPVAASRFLVAPDLGDFPLLYVSDPGWMVLSEREIAALTRYLRTGGVLWVDDFWGDAEWRQFEDVMRKVLPQHEWSALSATHPIFHSVYDLGEVPQIPAIDVAQPGGPTMEWASAHKVPMGPSETAEMRAWLDEEGRPMVIATHNTDTGDGWEREAYGQWYFEAFSTRAYMLAVNVVVYAMSH